MGIAISAGAGLLLGLGLLVWGLRERSKRHAAERAADKAESRLANAIDTAQHNGNMAAKMEDQKVRLEKQVNVLQERLGELRRVVAEEATIETVKVLLDSETKGETI